MDQHQAPSHQQGNVVFEYEQFLDALPIPPGLQANPPAHLLWHWLLAGVAAVLVLAFAGATLL